jgi:hypothetical protein
MSRQKAKAFSDGIDVAACKPIAIYLPPLIVRNLKARAKRDGVGVGRVAARMVLATLRAEQTAEAAPTPHEQNAYA